jgi:hypothetical protein
MNTHTLQVWQMTLPEYKRALQERTGPKGQEDVTFLGLDDESIGESMFWFSEIKRLTGTISSNEILHDPWCHKIMVDNAVAEGKPVPQRVIDSIYIVEH